jgi:hypothetical protein
MRALLLFLITMSAHADDILQHMQELMEWQVEALQASEQALAASNTILARLNAYERQYLQDRETLALALETISNQHLANYQHMDRRFRTIELLLGMGKTPSATHGVAHAPSEVAPLFPDLQIGNFLWMDDQPVKGLYTTMTLMSDYLHNGSTPNRQQSDVERIRILNRAKTEGNTIHLYGTNWDNYSSMRGFSFGWWDNIPNRSLFYNIETDNAHWYHWFVQARELDLTIVLWLWPNDAASTYNDPSKWPDNRVEEQMQRLIAFARQKWKGKKLCTDFVLKLEADDEWSIDRINRMSAAIRRFLEPDERLWYHNQTNELSILQQIDWSKFHGVRYQWMDASSLSDSQFVARFVETMKALPAHLYWVASEYTTDGSSPEAKARGDMVLSLRTQYPQIIGVDNGATVERWLK